MPVTATTCASGSAIRPSTPGGLPAHGRTREQARGGALHRTLGVYTLAAHCNNLEKTLRDQAGDDAINLAEQMSESREILATDEVFRQLVAQRSGACARESQLRETGNANAFPDRQAPQVAGYSIRKTYGRIAPPGPALVCLLLFALSFFASGGSGDGVSYLVGAHYYVWYPENFADGYLRGVLRPAQTPALGEYDSRSTSIAERHIALAVSHGIDFFTLDWWPNRPAQNAAIGSGFLGASNIGDIRFCIFYESTDLGDPTSNGIVFDAATKDRFVSDLMTIARRYFGHPSYLRIDGRPALVLYVTREMRGLFPQAMREMRRAMAAEGYDPFVIGDEIYWFVIDPEDSGAAIRVTSDPQLSRIRLFDAITAYNLYIESRERHRGYGSVSHFVADSAKLYRRYRDVAGIPIIPGVIPGFNDRAVRPGLDHFVIPRRWTAGAREGSFFAEAIERIGKPMADPKLHAILITSWNEWNEDTAIEPLSPSPPTADDASGQQLFTQGYDYEGFGSAYLDVVRDHLRH